MKNECYLIGQVFFLCQGSRPVSVPLGSVMFEKCHFRATVAEAFFSSADAEAEWNSTMVGSCCTTTEHQMG